MEGVVAARRLRKSMLQGNYLENSNEKRHHVKSDYKVNEKEEKRVKNEKASDMMIGKWVKCDKCKEIIYKEDLHQI